MLAAMPSADLTDYFQLGPALQAFLRDPSQGFGLVSVDDLAPLADALEGAKPAEIANRLSALAPRCPAAFVGYDAELTQWDSEDGGHLLFQRWLVVLVVKNAADTSRGGGVLADAGPLLMKLIGGLSGWKPDIQHLGALRHVAGPRPVFGTGIGLFPVSLLVPMYITGAHS